MKTNIRHSRGGWTIEEDNTLLNTVNKHCHPSGRMSWARVRLMPGRTFAAMQSRWKILHTSCVFDGKKWNWKDEATHIERKERTRKNIADEIRDFMKMYPDSDNSTVANFVNCDPSYVSRIRTQNTMSDTDIPKKKESARKTPANASTGVLPKRVVVKKSFLWGAFTFERYE
jgi:hypothetical protein